MITFEEFVQDVLDELVKSGADSRYTFTGIRASANIDETGFSKKNSAITDAAEVTSKMFLYGHNYSYVTDDYISENVTFDIFDRVVESICGDIRASIYRHIVSLSGLRLYSNTVTEYYGDITYYAYFQVNMGDFYNALVQTETEWS